MIPRRLDASLNWREFVHEQPRGAPSRRNPGFPVNRRFDKTLATPIRTRVSRLTEGSDSVIGNPKEPDRKNRPRALLAFATVAACAIFVFVPAARAQSSPAPAAQASPKAAGKPAHHKKGEQAKKRRVIAISVDKGGIYTITGLKKGAAVQTKTVANPNALSVQPQPSGDLVLLGTEAGRSRIDATLASGEQVTYDVTINAATPPINSLRSGTAPKSIAP
jgi:hypothetical protein